MRARTSDHHRRRGAFFPVFVALAYAILFSSCGKKYVDPRCYGYSNTSSVIKGSEENECECQSDNQDSIVIFFGDGFYDPSPIRLVVDGEVMYDSINVSDNSYGKAMEQVVLKRGGLSRIYSGYPLSVLKSETISEKSDDGSDLSWAEVSYQDQRIRFALAPCTMYYVINNCRARREKEGLQVECDTKHGWHWM